MNYLLSLHHISEEKMKKFDSRTYLFIAGGAMVLIVCLLLFYALTSVSRADEVQYVYIDADDTQDSVLAKIQPFAHDAGLTGLSTLIRHSSYGKHVRTGRYAVNPGENAITVFRRLKNGQQE